MKDIDFSRLVKPNIRTLKAYEAKEAPCKIKLDANESPYPLKVRIDRSVLGRLNRYPDPNGSELKKAIASRFRVRPEDILLGNGSDELISCLITAFGGPVLSPVPTFSMYGIISQALGEKFIGVPLNRDFDLDTKKMLAAMNRHRPRLIFLSSPNNPTGNCFSSDRILEIIDAAIEGGQPSLVIVDEAYQAFSGGKSFLPLIKKHPNLAVLRTFSKTGFAGLRVGYLTADRELVGEVNKVRLPFNLNSLSQAAALESFRDRKAEDSAVRAVISERERLFTGINDIKGIRPYRSDANFILFRVADASKVFGGLLRKGVLIRNLSGTIKDALRVTVGTPEENNAFLQALRTTVNTRRKK